MEGEGDKGTITLSGTLFGNSMPRLVMFNEYQLEGYLDGNLLVIDHQDKPGKYHIVVLALDEEPNAALCDGAVRFVSETVDCGDITEVLGAELGHKGEGHSWTGPSTAGVWGASATPNHGESVAL